MTQSTSSTRQLTKDEEDALFTDLQTYRNCLCRTDDGYVTPLFGFEIASGIPDSVLKRIIKDCTAIQSVDDVKQFGIVSDLHAADILTVIKSYV